MHFYALNAKIRNLVISVEKDAKTDWEWTIIVDYFLLIPAYNLKKKLEILISLNYTLFTYTYSSI